MRAVRLAAFAAGLAGLLAIIGEVTRIVITALAVPALARDLALRLLIHRGESAPRGTARRMRRAAARSLRFAACFGRFRSACGFRLDRLGVGALTLRASMLALGVLIMAVRIVVRHGELLGCQRRGIPAGKSSWSMDGLQSLCHAERQLKSASWPWCVPKL